MIFRALVVAVVVLLPLGGSLPAAAHTEVALVEPTDGSRVESLPKEVTIRAGAEVESAQIVITMPGGRVERLAASVDGFRVSAPLPSYGLRGEYAVAYRLVAADGHAKTGAVRFTVTQGAEPDVGAVAEEASSSGVPVIGLTVGAAVLLVVGAMLALVRVRR